MDNGDDYTKNENEDKKYTIEDMINYLGEDKSFIYIITWMLIFNNYNN